MSKYFSPGDSRYNKTLQPDFSRDPSDNHVLEDLDRRLIKTENALNQCYRNDTDDGFFLDPSDRYVVDSARDNRSKTRESSRFQNHLKREDVCNRSKEQRIRGYNSEDSSEDEECIVKLIEGMKDTSVEKNTMNNFIEGSTTNNDVYSHKNITSGGKRNLKDEKNFLSSSYSSVCDNRSPNRATLNDFDIEKASSVNRWRKNESDYHERQCFLEQELLKVKMDLEQERQNVNRLRRAQVENEENHQTKVNSLKKDLKTASGKLKDLESTVASQAQQLRATEHEKQLLQTDLFTFQNTKAQQDHSINKLRKELSELEDDYKSVVRQNQHYTNDYETLNKELRSSHDTIAEMRDQLAYRKDEEEKLKEELRSQSELIDVHLIESKNLQARTTELEKYQREAASLKQEVKLLRNEVEKSKFEAQRSVAEIKDLEKKLKEVTSQLQNESNDRFAACQENQKLKRFIKAQNLQPPTPTNAFVATHPSFSIRSNVSRVGTTSERSDSNDRDSSIKEPLHRDYTTTCESVQNPFDRESRSSRNQRSITPKTETRAAGRSTSRIGTNSPPFDTFSYNGSTTPSRSTISRISEGGRALVDNRVNATGVGIVMGQGLGLSHFNQSDEKVISMNKQLTVLTIERDNLSAKLARAPKTSSGRTLKERQELEMTDRRFNEVENRIHKLRQEIKKSQTCLKNEMRASCGGGR